MASARTVAVVVPSPAMSLVLSRRFLDQLGPQVFVGVVQANVLGHGNAVFGYLRGTPTLVQNGVSAARAQGARHRPSQLADADGQRVAGLVFKDHLFCHSGFLLLLAF